MAQPGLEPGHPDLHPGALPVMLSSHKKSRLCFSTQAAFLKCSLERIFKKHDLVEEDQRVVTTRG